MLVLTLLACGIDLPVKPVPEDREVLALDSIDAGDGGTISEFVADQLTTPLKVDWSFANLPGLAPDTAELSPDELPADGDCLLDEDGAPSECSFPLAITVTSASGWWAFQAEDRMVTWRQDELSYDFSADVALDADQASEVAAALGAQGIAFSGESLWTDINRGSDGSGYGLPTSAQRNVILVTGVDDNTGNDGLLAADDTVDGE